jgi:hypothetical protein
MQGDRGRFVITAAHCLPFFPPCHGASYLEERTYKALLGPLGAEPTIWAECLFADPIADIAVLGSADNQELSDEADAYSELTEGVRPLSIGEPVWQEGRAHISRAIPSLGIPEQRFVLYYEAPAWLLSRDSRWFRCVVRHNGGMLMIVDPTEGIVGGMSGSPILTDDGLAVGIVCLSGGTSEVHTAGGPNPRLLYNLPGWLLRQLTV